jgi:predicted CXXCH cytochrome family protein
MKRLFTALVVALLVVAASGAALALVGNIKNTKHDLSSGSTATTKSTNENEICVFCHTPHRARVAVPLWNRDASSASYTTYNSTTIQGVRDSITGSSSNISVLCLSCHDGTISLGAIVNNYPAGAMARDQDPAMTGSVAAGPTPPAGSLTGTYTKLGTNLAGTHPIAIAYNTTPGDLVATASIGPCELFNNKVECSSCHAVHGGTGHEPFLRVTMTGSALCLKCHLK